MGDPGKGAWIRVNAGQTGQITRCPTTRGKLPILMIPAWGARILVDTGSDSTVVDAEALQGIAPGKKVRPCRCTVRTMTGVQPLLGEVTVDFGEVTGRPMIRQVHVASIPTPEYEVILGGDLLSEVGGTIDVSARSWKIRLGKKTYQSRNGVRGGRHISVSAAKHESEEERLANEMAREFEAVFYQEGEPLAATGRVRHRIELLDKGPVWVPARRYPEAQMGIIDQEIRQMLREGIIRPSVSPYSSPLWVVPKPPGPEGEERFRVVVDYRALNAKTKRDKYPLPRFEEMIDRMWGANVFSTLDLRSGYHQIRMDPEDAEKTAFTFRRGHYQFERMPFGLTNAPATFQRLMDEFLEGLEETYVQVYMDDIIVFSRGMREHREDLRKVLRRLKEFNLRVSRDKTQLARREVKFMGHILSEQGVRTDPGKVQAIGNLTAPRDVKELRGFLGLANYYRRFVGGFSGIAEPLTALTKKGAWRPIEGDALTSFEKLKQALSTAPVLKFPNFEEAFTLTTDASQVAAGAVLSQGTAEGERPVAYASKKFTPCETRYSAIERELLAIVWAVEHFRPYLWGRKFLVRTDHKPLLWVGKLKESSARVTRLKERLTPYDFDLVHTKGVQNVVADFLSRHVNAIETAGSPFDVGRYVDEAFGIVREDRGQQERENTPMEPEELDDLVRTTYEQEWQENVDDLRGEERPRPWDSKPETINTKLWQVIVREVPGRGFNPGLKRYHKQRIYQVEIGRETPEEEVAEGYNQILGGGNLFHVYLDEERQRELLRKLYTTRKVGENTTIVECQKKVETVFHPERQERILAAYHGGVNNHRGVGATLADLRRRFYWWDMIGTIRDHILQCDVCAQAKYVRTPRERPQRLTPTARDPLDRVQADLFQWEGSRFLVLVDEATRLAMVQRVRNKTARTIRTTLLQLFAAHGRPRTLIMDQGREFKNGLIEELLEDLGIRAHYTTPGHPRSHGMVERLQGSLTEHLQLLRLGRQLTGEEAMWRAVLAYNSSVHSGTDRVPFEEMRGVGPDGQQHPEEYPRERQEQQDRQLRRKEHRVRKLNRRRPVAEDYKVRVGDRVFRKNWFKRTKEGARYTGPYTVERVLARDRAVIRGTRRGARLLVTHLNELRLPTARRRMRE